MIEENQDTQFQDFNQELSVEVSKKISAHISELTLANFQNTAAAELFNKRLRYYEDKCTFLQKRINELEAAVQEPE